MYKGTILKKENLATIIWEADSREVLFNFPKSVKKDIGYALDRLQRGLRPFDFKYMGNIAPGVFELRERNRDGWYRLIYYSKIEDIIYVIHCFQKKTNQTSQRDIKVIKERLKILKKKIKESR